MVIFRNAILIEGILVISILNTGCFSSYLLRLIIIRKYLEFQKEEVYSWYSHLK